MDEYVEANRRLWDEWADIHYRSAFYDVEGFKAGTSPRLHDLEIEEVGDVAGKSLLHLQCHFGLDTLAWARRGARVTGADFSPRAIELARSVAAEVGIDARFVCSSLEDLPSVLEGSFDIVFASYGVLGWLPDLRPWARAVAHFLAPGGTFYIAEFHPVGWVFDDAQDAMEPRVRYPYFRTRDPLAFPVKGTYADPDAEVREPFEYGWPFTLGEVVTLLAEHGLRIEFLHEFPYCHMQFLAFLERDEEGRWVPPLRESIPLLFSIKATRER